MIEQHVDVARLLIEQGARQNIFAHAGIGDVEAVRQSLQQDPARAFLPDGEGHTPLVYAAATNQMAVARLLLTEGGLVKLQPRRHGEGYYRIVESPADWAALHGHAEMLNLLLDAGDPLTPEQLHDAVRLGHLAAVKVLIAHRADIEARNHSSKTPLHLAALFGQPDVAAALIEAGADLEAKVGWFSGGGCGPPGGFRATNETPLHLAARYAKPEVVQVLLSAKANVAARTTNRQTPLLSAAGKEPLTPAGLEVVKLLLDNGANINAKDKAGDNALARAKMSKDAALTALLRRGGAVDGADDPAAKDDPVAKDDPDSDDDSGFRGMDDE